MITFRDATEQDAEAICSLNDAVVEVTSPMDADRFKHLLDLSNPCIAAEKDGEVIGFVLAMQIGAGYANDNFNWFAARLNNFVYIDRIVIGAAGQRQGLGVKLYEAVADAARAQGCLIMCAEMDLDPPNEQSLAFHAKSGFVALGTRTYETGKVVSMQVKGL